MLAVSMTKHKTCGLVSCGLFLEVIQEKTLSTYTGNISHFKTLLYIPFYDFI